MNVPLIFRCALAVIVMAPISFVAQARQRELPYSWLHPASISTAALPRVTLAAVDQASLLAKDARDLKGENGAVEKKLRVAEVNRVSVTPANDGRWEALADGGRLWRISIHADGATDFRLGFSRFKVPAGVTLHLVNDSAHTFAGPFSADDATPDGQLWLAPFAGNTLTLELHVPSGVTLEPDAIVLTRVGSGYRNTTETGGPGLFGGGVSGACNIDVICPLGNSYRAEIKAVAKFYFDEPDGTYLCTGTLMNDTVQDFKPYFLTANHCINTQAAATSMSLIWNYESPTCGQHGGGSDVDTQNGGATLVANRADADFSLVRLNSTPSAGFDVVYAGWVASTDVPLGSIGIHHPSGWMKAITQNTHTLTTINNCIGTGGGSTNTHWQTGPYAQGTTEGGSSGSALLIPAGDPSGYGNRVIGMLSGGGAACSGSVPNNQPDCYGKFSVAWDGASSSVRLRDWLAPGPSDRIFANGFESGAVQLDEPVSAPTVTRPAQ
jgi:V8-like Glu-specific endopeptidase